MKRRLAVANVGDGSSTETDEDEHLARRKDDTSRTGDGLMNAESFRAVTD